MQLYHSDANVLDIYNIIFQKLYNVMKEKQISNSYVAFDFCNVLFKVYLNHYTFDKNYNKIKQILNDCDIEKNSKLMDELTESLYEIKK